MLEIVSYDVAIMDVVQGLKRVSAARGINGDFRCDHQPRAVVALLDSYRSCEVELHDLNSSDHSFTINGLDVLKFDENLKLFHLSHR